MTRTALATFGLAAVLFAAGCADDDGTGEVVGTVTLDGKPLDTGAVQFAPTDGKSPTAGAPIRAGRFTARVPTGEMTVRVTAPKVVGKRKLYDTPDSPEMPVTEELLPAKYNAKSELKTVVRPGRNAVTFDLTTN